MPEAAVFSRKLASYFLFLTCVLHFMLDPGSGTGMHYVPVPLRQKVAVPVP
jgi:hypothetical protein